MVRFRSAVILTCLAAAVAVPARAGWEAPEWRARVEMVSSSDLFPGYVDTGPDRGVRSELEAEASRRLSHSAKLGLGILAGAVAFRHFEEARHGWLGAATKLRAGVLRFDLEGAWTPRRVKFPSVPEDASFSRLEWRAGIRAPLWDALGARLEGRWERDDYVPSFDGRDAHRRGGLATLEWRASEGLAFIGRGEISRRTTVDPDHRFAEHELGGKATWSIHAWRVGGEVRTGVRRYPEADPADANHRRRDQWQELRLEIVRALPGHLDLRSQAAFRTRLSSRIDRAYDVTTFALGIEWSGRPQ